MQLRRQKSKRDEESYGGVRELGGEKVRERREMKEGIESEIKIPRGSGGELPGYNLVKSSRDFCKRKMKKAFI